MEGGKIIAQGTHEELLEKCEAYALFCEQKALYAGMLFDKSFYDKMNFILQN